MSALRHEDARSFGSIGLRPFDPSDAARIAYLVGEFAIARHLARVPYPYSLRDAHHFIDTIEAARQRREEFSFAVTLPLDGLIGACGVRRMDGRAEAFELGYWLGRPYWGRGLATAAGRAVLDWAVREAGAKVVFAGHFADNPASGAVLRKLGFVRTHAEPLFGLARGETAPAERYVWPEDASADKGIAHAPH